MILSFSASLTAQVTREELEKQKADLKKDLEQTERLLNENKAKSKENYVQWKLINDKVNHPFRLILLPKVDNVVGKHNQQGKYP